jgi:RNA polymerase sigma factor (sigma-70 family)
VTDSLYEDQRLLAACLTGDREAVAVFVRRFSGLVYYAVRYVLTSKGISFSTDDLEDLHNAVFLYLLEDNGKKLSQYQGKNGCSLASWLRVVTVRRVLNHMRDHHVQSTVPQKEVFLEDLPDPDWEDLGPIALMEQAERMRFLRDAIQLLPPRDRLCIKLYFEDGLSLESIASTLNISVQTVYTLKYRAVQRLRSHLMPYQ